MYLLYMFLRHSVLTVTFIHHRMVEMLSIMPVSIRNGILRSFSFWRELILMSRIRWVLVNINFTDPYHLCRYCITIVIDDSYLYLVVYHIVNYYYNSCLPLNSNGHILDSLYFIKSDPYHLFDSLYKFYWPLSSIPILYNDSYRYCISIFSRWCF